MNEVDIVNRLFGSDGAIERTIIDWFLNKRHTSYTQHINFTQSSFYDNIEVDFKIVIPKSEAKYLMEKMRNGE